jgi:hypothetical protein
MCNKIKQMSDSTLQFLVLSCFPLPARNRKPSLLPTKIEIEIKAYLVEQEGSYLWKWLLCHSHLTSSSMHWWQQPAAYLMLSWTKNEGAPSHIPKCRENHTDNCTCVTRSSIEASCSSWFFHAFPCQPEIRTMNHLTWFASLVCAGRRSNAQTAHQSRASFT